MSRLLDLSAQKCDNFRTIPADKHKTIDFPYFIAVARLLNN